MTNTPDDELRALREDLRRRGRRSAEPKKIADVLSGLLSRRGYARELASSDFEDAWRKAAGERFAKDSRPGNIKGGVLEVTVRNSAVLQELTFQKRQILKTLRELAPQQKIRDLRLRVGEIGA